MSIAALNPSLVAAGGAGRNVMDAIARAADRTGSNFDYLLRTAQRESSLNPQAKSKSSSATGLFQFIEQTWLRTVKDHGAKHGLEREAALIKETASGKLEVSNPTDRQAILALRKDPEIAALMAGELTNDSQRHLENRLGRGVSGGELYLAHFFGAEGAARFLTSAEASPSALAAAAFPKAAAANRSIFFDETGNARTFAQVKSHLTRAHGAEGATSLTAVAPKPMPMSVAAEVTDMAALGEGTGSQHALSRFAGTALRLTPEILTILSSLDPIPETVRASGIYRAAARSGG